MSNFRDWARRQSLNRGHSNRRSSFPTEREARDYAGNIDKYSKYTGEYVESISRVGHKWVVVTKRR